jgi:hypothetical protein
VTSDDLPAPGTRYELTDAEIAAMRRARDAVAVMQAEPDPYDDPDFPDTEAGWTCWYVNDEGGVDPDDDPAVAAEFVGSETVYGLTHSYWRVTTRTGRTFWVIDEPARSCYDGERFDHIADAMYQHIGVTVRMAESMGQECPYR